MNFFAHTSAIWIFLVVYESQLPGGWVGGKYQKSETQMADGGVTLTPQGIHNYIYSITRHVLCELQKYFQKLYTWCCSDSQGFQHYIFLHAISLVWPSKRYHYRKLCGWCYFDPIGIQHYIFHHATSLVWPSIRCHCCKHFIILKMSTEYTLDPENTRAMQTVSFIICTFLSDCRAGDQKPHKLTYTSVHWLQGILWVGYPQDSEEIDL